MRKILYILLTLPLFTFGQAQDSCYSVTDFMSQTETVNPTITKNFTAGWNMFGYPCMQSLDLVEALSSIIDKVIIVKNNNGSVYMPEFGFNGIGNLESGEGYQIKLSDTEYGFFFCESINWPDIEGCTDCEAANFYQWANIDDGSCYVEGCMEETACNFNPESSMPDGSCEYPEQGYDCDGYVTAEIGDIMEGGYLFYIDETRKHGLVAGPQDIGTYEWGCYNETVDGANGRLIGTGYQNTLDIVNEVCDSYWGGGVGAEEALSYESDGYKDWYLPSINELLEMCNTIGLYNNEGNNFANFNYTSYLSSTKSEEYLTHANHVLFNNCNIYPISNHTVRSVRPIRTF
jgi:hypothetical protein